MEEARKSTASPCFLMSSASDAALAKGLVNGRSCCGHRDGALFFMKIPRHAWRLYLQVVAQRRAGKFVALRRTAGAPCGLHLRFFHYV